ncbi:MAG: hypothetical protein ACLQRH_25385 [Acidimicrobiales bacterium]
MATSTRASASHHHVEELVVVVVVVVVDGVDGRVVVVAGAVVVVVAGPVVVVAGAVVVVVGAVVVVAGAVLVVAGAVVVVVGAATAVDAVAGGRTLPPLFVGMLEVVEDPAPAPWDGEPGPDPHAARNRPAPTASDPTTPAVARWWVHKRALIPAPPSPVAAHLVRSFTRLSTVAPVRTHQGWSSFERVCRLLPLPTQIG